nr:EscU/YscU/HrcU family type III secretion system export apparatus switch protein [Chenggangzhangella methanolivorans]
MMAAVPGATVVIANPTHFAVALKYEAGMNAPMCVAKGVDAIALRIRRVAEEAGVTVIENPPARPFAARGARDRPGDPGRALQGGRRGHRLRHAAQGRAVSPPTPEVHMRPPGKRHRVRRGSNAFGAIISFGVKLSAIFSHGTNLKFVCEGSPEKMSPL